MLNDGHGNHFFSWIPCPLGFGYVVGLCMMGFSNWIMWRSRREVKRGKDRHSTCCVCGHKVYDYPELKFTSKTKEGQVEQLDSDDDCPNCCNTGVCNIECIPCQERLRTFYKCVDDWLAIQHVPDPPDGPPPNLMNGRLL